jgi:phosphinothricin acetyltransferase
MNSTIVRPAIEGDLPRLTRIYNYYVVNTPITFDLRPLTVEERRPWFDEHSEHGRYRLLVADDGAGQLLGYVSTGRFRSKAAYDPTVETSIYCAPEAVGRGIGTLLYRELFRAIAEEDIHRLVAGITLPNTASVALHRRFRFHQVGIFSANGRKFGRYWDVGWFERAHLIE